ncbi:MAG: DNA double-strand break repair nuclease NurA [Candidatus Caenarcaniphilales bacterium]|nr:DNA double-strand break repair nuclease NurA [Candidatus Caenarcaniphilales bacterium]
MLNLSKVYKALEAKRALIENYSSQNLSNLKRLFALCEKLNEINHENFNKFIEASNDSFSGAIATEELTARGLVIETIDQNFDVKAWKEQILKDRITFATDGSQIEPDKNLNLFLGAVQCGWFINFHNAEQAPIKDVEFEIILAEEPSEESDKELRQEIAFQRFDKEIRTLARLIEEYGGANLPAKSSPSPLDRGNQILKSPLACQGEGVGGEVTITERGKLPIAFFDGSLTLSFVKEAKWKRRYTESVNYLISKSFEYKVPVVGFIDTSLASNLTKSLQVAFDSTSNIKISDAAFLGKFLSNWGSRSAFFKYYEKTENSVSESQIGFVYLKNSSRKNKPSRVELPLWVYEEDLLDEVLSVVLAESLVGNGYPYPIEVADSIAVLQKPERELFYELVGKRTEQEISLSSKQNSKNIRRRPKIVV